MPVQIQAKAPDTLKQARFEPRGPVTPSPADWRDQIFYFLLPDRFSNGRETGEMLFDPKSPERSNISADGLLSGLICRPRGLRYWHQFLGRN
jgi:hypothetical protein